MSTWPPIESTWDITEECGMCGHSRHNHVDNQWNCERMGTCLCTRWEPVTEEEHDGG